MAGLFVLEYRAHIRIHPAPVHASFSDTMKFVDEAIIEVIAGKGGDGAASFRRESMFRAAARMVATAGAAQASTWSPTAILIR